MTKKSNQNEGENPMEKEVKTNKPSWFKWFVTVVIMLLALNILIGNFILLLPLFIVDFPRISTFNIPSIIISSFGAIYSVLIVFLLLMGKNEIVTKISLFTLIPLITAWFMWRAVNLITPLVLGFSVRSIPNIIDFILSPIAIAAIFIYLLKTKKGNKNNES